jgi:hypothetical protein
LLFFFLTPISSEPREIAVAYLKGWFWIDAFSCLPVGLGLGRIVALYCRSLTLYKIH